MLITFIIILTIVHKNSLTFKNKNTTKSKIKKIHKTILNKTINSKNHSNNLINKTTLINNQKSKSNLKNKTKTFQELVNPKTLNNNPNGILLQIGGFETDKGEVILPSNLTKTEEEMLLDSPSSLRYIIQFTGPVQNKWKNQISLIGGKIENYIPNNAFVVKIDPTIKESLYSLPFIQWIGIYQPAFKLASSLLTKDHKILKQAKKQNLRNNVIIANNQKNISNIEKTPQEIKNINSAESSREIEITENQNIMLLVQTFEKGELQYLYNLIESFDEVFIIKSNDNRKSKIIIEFNENKIDEVTIKLANETKIEWIEPYIPPQINNDSAAWVVQSNIENQNSIYDKGITGTGQIIGVGDTGLDADMVFFYDESQGLPNSTKNINQRKVISYHDLAGNGDWDSHDHGTHVAGTIAGKSLSTNSKYNGIAYDAKLVIQDIGTGGSLTGIPSDLNTYFQQAYNDGARIHSNSWGASVGGAYTSMSQDCDQFMWNNKDFLICFSAGNSGSSTNTIGSPATAKNILTSGASENAHHNYNQEDVAYFSSNGPTDDGRIKPTVCAPGHYVSSADSDWDVSSFNSGIRTMSGTSMSCPTHAGTAALVRQYYVDGFYPTGIKNANDSFNPSAALIKATMVNSAVNMTGSYTDAPIPSTGQGWGRVLIDNTLYFESENNKLYIDDNNTGLETGNSFENIFSSNGTNPIKITLVWTDYYPSLAASKQIVNDLDLKVEGPSGTFFGNVFSNGESITGGSYDKINVVEQVLIKNPTSGSYTITISGSNIPNGPQPYALVVTGLSQSTSKGKLYFDKKQYKNTSTVNVTVIDKDLDTNPSIETASIFIQSTNSEQQKITLTETGLETGIFKTSFIVEDILNVNHNDILKATYKDSDNGEGELVMVEAQALIDLEPPLISNVSIINLSEEGATISFDTNEKCTGILYYREKNSTNWNEKLLLENTSHLEKLSGLKSGTFYQIKISVTDLVDYSTTDDNDGNFYSFSTDAEVLIYSDDIENDPQFTVSGSDGAGGNALWHISTYKSNSPTKSWYYGLENIKSYDTGYTNYGYLTSNQITLPNYDNFFIKFNHILKTENYSPYDIGKVQISNDGVTWTTVFQATKTDTNWQQEKINITQYINQNFYFRFYFNTIDEIYNNYEGWLIDDIKIVSYLPDEDGDGLTDDYETQIGTDPKNSDTDNDGLSDGIEVKTYKTDPLKADTDEDGLNDGDEINTHKTDPLKTDTDEDGLSDSEEINTYGTNPLKKDSDNDLINDKEEVDYWNLQNGIGKDYNSDYDNDGVINILDQDSDNDGVWDGIEILYEFDPANENEKPNLPDINVTNGSYDFGTISFNTTKTISYTLENLGDAELTISGNITITGDNASEFIVTKEPSSSIANGTSSIFEIKYQPNSIGTHNATLSISHNDLDENPFSVTLTGRTSNCLANSPAPKCRIDLQNTGRNINGGTPHPQKRWKMNTTGFFFAVPVIGKDGTIYAGSDLDDRIYAITNNGDSYTIKWSYEVSLITATPIIGEDGSIYVFDWYGKVTALKDNGNSVEKRWEIDLNTYIYDSPAIGKDGTLYIGGESGKLYAIQDNGNSASLKWKKDITDYFFSAPVISDEGTIYIVDGSGKCFALTDNGDSVSQKWTFDLNSYTISSPAIGNDKTIYIGCENNKLYALKDNETSASIKWEFLTGNKIIWSSAAISNDGTIFIGSTDQKIYALTDNGNSVTKKWDFDVGGKIYSSPIIDSNGIIYIGNYYTITSSSLNIDNTIPKKWETDSNGKILKTRFNDISINTSISSKLFALIDNGNSVTKKWEITLDEPIWRHPVIDENGAIYIGADWGGLYSIQMDPLGDPDNDGLKNEDEVTNKTDWKNPDTDNDGLKDGEEVNTYGSNPLKKDTDSDGVNDAEEIKYNFDPTNPNDAGNDDDNDGLNNYEEAKIGTDQNKKDTDNDGLNDLQETLIKSNPLKADTDGDTLKDGEEFNTYGSNPLKADTDNDGLNDKEEIDYWTNMANVNYDSDSDNDGTINLLDQDSDNDGFSDGLEFQFNSDPLDKNKFPDTNYKAKKFTSFGYGNFDKDGGYNDFIIKDSNNGNYILYLTTKEEVTTQTILSIDSDWELLFLGDFDNSIIKTTDMLWRNKTTGEIAIYLAPSGSIYPQDNIINDNVSLKWVLTDVNDFNGDGKSDIVFRNVKDARFCFWIMDGKERVSISQYGLTDKWSFEGTADLNGDNKNDIIFRNIIDARFCFWIMDGTQRVSMTQYGLTDKWSFEGTTDLNGDNKSDIIFRNKFDARFCFWIMNENERISMAQYNLSDKWEIIGTNDFNSDNNNDIVFRHIYDGRICAWFMNGDKRLSHEILSLDTNYTIKSFYDYNQDNFNDIILNDENQNIIVLTMDDWTKSDKIYIN